MSDPARDDPARDGGGAAPGGGDSDPARDGGGDDPAAILAARLADRSAVVGVLGLGYIGLPVAGLLARGGFPVLGFDSDPAKLEALAAGRDYLVHVGPDFAAGLLATGRFTPCEPGARLAQADVLVLCVPTPLDAHNQPDLSAVTATAEVVAAHLRPGQLVVLESTTYPGTTRELVQPILEATGLAVGRDVFLAYAPERVDPGRREPPLEAVPRLVGGLDDTSRDLALALYGAVFSRVVPVSSVEVAEAAKLLENVYRAVNIALVNELKTLLLAMDVDVDEVIDAAATKPYGFQPFRPGPGLGGHCLPIDPFYLAHRARQLGLPARFIELAGEVNRAMPSQVVARTLAALGERGRPVDGAAVLVLGLAYKPDVDDTRESPSFVIIEELLAAGVRVDYHDPWVPATRPVRHARCPSMTSVPLEDGVYERYDAVVIATDHGAVDYDRLAREARLVIDTRGVMRGRGGRVVVA